METLNYLEAQRSHMAAALASLDAAEYGRQLQAFSAHYYALSLHERYPHKETLINGYYDFSRLQAALRNETAAYLHLEKALALGFTRFSQLDRDPFFEGVSSTKAFREVVEPYRKAKDFLAILRGSDRYDPAGDPSLPVFSYQEAAAPELIRLKDELELDTVAGQGYERARILNLMRWLHSCIRHDGEHGSLTGIDTLQKVHYCIKEHKGLNCRGMAGIFNACLLALGFKSRVVICKPKDLLGTDTDSHVINIVYIRAQQKWVWVDVALGAYVLDERKEMLSVQEVRERLIDGRPLLLNPDANWNQRVLLTKEEYLYRYMAKNLYRFSCPLRSAYEGKSSPDEKALEAVHLLPWVETAGGAQIVPENLHGEQYTCSPEYFWQKPAADSTHCQ